MPGLWIGIRDHPSWEELADAFAGHCGQVGDCHFALVRLDDLMYLIAAYPLGDPPWKTGLDVVPEDWI